MQHFWKQFKNIFLYSTFLIIFLLLPTIQYVQAVGNSSNIVLEVGSDVISPTIPTGLTATALSSSQINLAWNASTDAYGVVGYHVYRDNVLIATTSSPTISYSDAGLSASTLYAYTVSAFDAVPLESARSATSSATTLAITGGGGGGTPLPITSNIVIVVSTSTALLTWDTDRFTVGSITWGETPSLELGSISEAGYELSHSLLIDNLDPYTLYYYEIEVIDSLGQNVREPIADFTTGSLPDTTAPANVSNFTVAEESGSLRLVWDNPPDADFSYVRIVRSETFFPLDPTDGIVVYEGPLETVLDSSLTPGVTYYYTNFSADENDNYASGAVASGFVTPPPDVTPPANVSNFTVAEESGSLRLVWDNPSDADFSYVHIMRSDTTFPSTPLEGDLVYESGGETVLDSSISAGVTYYYTVFSYDTSGNYSSGAIDSGNIAVIIVPSVICTSFTYSIWSACTPLATKTRTLVTSFPTGCTGGFPVTSQSCTYTTSPPTGGGAGGSVTPDPDSNATTTPATTTPPIIEPEPDPFASLPIAITTSEDPIIIKQIKQVEAIEFSDFEIIQGGKKQRFARGGSISIDANESFMISIAYDKTPEVLKTIGAVLQHPEDSSKTFALLLRVNEDKTAYEAVIAPLNKPGRYETTMYVLNHSNQQIKKVYGSYIVQGEEKQTELVPKSISKVVGATGVGIGVTQIIVLTSRVASLSDIWLLFLRLMTLLTGPFRKKRSEPWGVVYDSITKRPLDPAYVMITKQGEEKGEAVTDLDGRYGFLMQPGTYALSAAKTHYAFPSKKLSGKIKDELYDNLYFGQDIDVGNTEVLSYNIPLDPIEFDWNEFAKQRQQLYILHSRNQRMKSIILNTFFFFGFAFSLYATWITPSILNYSIITSYIGILLFQYFWKVTHKLTRVLNKETGVPLSFAIVKAYMAHNNVQSKTVVTDQYGHFYMLLPPSSYYFTIEEKQSDGSYTLVHTTPSMELKRGVILENFQI